jgi:methylated-DNA-[protein]-cysteine S-methyltransferase
MQLSIFATDLGWFGMWGRDARVIALAIGQDSPAAVRRAYPNLGGNGNEEQTPDECDWNPKLRRKLEQFARGSAVEFSDIEVSLPQLSDFQRRVIEATRRVRYGETIAYGELAARAGYPGAARAVGSVMSSNRLPIIVPCHRVIAAGGKLGGFSAPSGVCLKQTMLALEAQHATHKFPSPSGRG